MAAFRVHLLVHDEAGPLASGPAPGGLAAIKPNPSHVRVACDPTIQMTDFHRGTSETWAVVCDDCEKTDDYKRLYQPRPGRATSTPTVAHASKPAGCCD